MVGRAVIFVVLAMFVIAGVITKRINASGKAQTENAVSYYKRQMGKNIAQTGVSMALRKLADNSSWRTGFASSGSPMDLFDGKVYVTLSDINFFSKPVVNITSISIMSYGTSNERRDTSIAYVLKPTTNPTRILAAITTNNNVTTLGGLDVDGRDHDTSGNVISLAGVLGIWTTGTITQSGSSDIGGTSTTPVDYPPSRPADPSVIAQNQVYPGGYPGTPDSVFGGASNGYPEGTLKSIAMSRIGGSQYTTNPATLNYPLRGVTYVELPNNSSWGPIASGKLVGSGILIVHNSFKNARIDNINNNAGTFRGIVIVDDIVHIHNRIIGAIISLTPAPSDGNTIGNGNGEVWFSKQAINNASTSYLNSGLSGSENSVIAWWE